MVISPSVNEKIRTLAENNQILWNRRAYQPGDLEGASIVIAVTNSNEINKSIAHEAEARNILLNVADVPSLCTFIAPSVVKRGEVTIATSTGGASPALARKFRQELSKSPILEYAELAPLLKEMRTELRRRGTTINADHWQAAITSEIISMVKENAVGEARSSLLSNLMLGSNCECPKETCMMWDKKTLTSGLEKHNASTTKS